MTSHTRWNSFSIFILPHKIQKTAMKILFRKSVALFVSPESVHNSKTFFLLLSNLRDEFENRSDRCAITISITKTVYLGIVFSGFSISIYHTKSLFSSVLRMLFHLLIPSRTSFILFGYHLGSF